ncbi:MAG: hypothetical protein IT335_11790, partial [Thermomicrobiales bacterium]|nr:hypothetical protein [Thermomicrobiales bacterium]
LDDEDRQIVLAGTISGIYLSRNGGRAWRPVFTREEGLLDIESIAIADRVAGGWTGLASSHTARLLRSDDGGLTWLASPCPEPECGAIAVVRSHTSPPAIAIAAGTSVFLSGDAGAEWDRVGSFAAPVMSLLALEHDALLAGVGGDGIKRVHLDDNVWTSADTGLEATFSATLAVIDTHTGPPVLFVASADADAAFSADLGKTWTPAPHDLRPAGAGDLLPASADGSLMLRTDHGLVRYSLEKEQFSVLLDAEISLYDVDADRIVAMNESGRIWASFDSGQTWTQHDGPPLPVGLKLSPPTNQPGMLAVACQVANESGRVSIYVAGMDRWDWARLPSETAVDPLTLVWVAASDQTVGVVLVCTSALHLYEQRPGSSGPAESSWMSQTMHISPGIRFTNARPCCVGNALFFGTTDGVYCLDSMKRTLEPWNEGLRGVPVLDISPATIGGRRELLALCLGGSIWRTIV